MSIIYRTTGPWGVGKGSNLTAAEGDGNFYDLDVRIDDLETTRPQPDNFANVAIDGTRISFTLVSGAVLGPLDLPVLKWRFRRDWAALTGYAANDTFRVVGDGLYLVLLDHISDVSFDPAAFATGDTVAAGSFVVGQDYTILTVGTTDFTLIGAGANTTGVSFTATGAGAGTGTATINLPLYYLLLALGLDLFADGIATFLGDPTSANLAAAVTDESGTGPLVFGRDLTTLSKTTNYTITTDNSGVSFDNIGASGDINLTLPAAAAGLHCGFAVYEAHFVKFTADGTDNIAIAGTNSADGGYVRSNTPYSFIKIEAHGVGQWIATSMTGSWSTDT